MGVICLEVGLGAEWGRGSGQGDEGGGREWKESLPF